jgi:hypothetical protein
MWSEVVRVVRDEKGRCNRWDMCQRDRTTTCQLEIGHYMHMRISGPRKAVLKFLAFGPDLCLWLKHSASKNHGCFPTLSYLFYGPCMLRPQYGH